MTNVNLKPNGLDAVTHSMIRPPTITRHPKRSLAGVVAALSAFALAPAPALAAAAPSSPLVSSSTDSAKPDLVGQRRTVRVKQLLTYHDPAKSYTGSLQRGQSFKVSRVSPTGTYAYGFAYGKTNTHAWVRTRDLLKGGPAAQVSPLPTYRLAGTPTLYAVHGGKTAGYVVFRTTDSLPQSGSCIGADACLVKTEVHGSSGRARHAIGTHCYRVSLTESKVTLHPGHRYQVRFQVRRSASSSLHTVTTRKLTAHRLTTGDRTPELSCSGT